MNVAVTLQARPLTPAAFAPFGTVVGWNESSPARPINAGTSQRVDLLDDLALTKAAGRPMLAVFRAQARTFPLPIAELERHALGSQVFIPLGTRRFVIVVAPAGAAADALAPSAFVTDGAQGIVLAPGVWHHALLAVDAGDFAVIERRAKAEDCEVVRLPVPLTLLL